MKFFPNDNVTGSALAAPGIASDLDYAPLVNGVGNPLPANPTSAAISGIWNGYLEAPDSGFFRLRIKADEAAIVELLLDDKPVSQLCAPYPKRKALGKRAIDRTGQERYPITLTVKKVSKVLSVQWEWVPKGQGARRDPGALSVSGGAIPGVQGGLRSLFERQPRWRLASA